MRASSSRGPGARRSALPVFSFAAAAAASLFAAHAALATPLSTSAADFVLPGTQPSTITDPIAPPSDCTTCHASYGRPEIEPHRVWQGSMLAQAGRDPLMYAALAISEQDAPGSGETCIRCHMPKGWLEGRSTPSDASATTAADRQGVQCNFCHRLVDPAGSPGAPAEDAAILAGLDEPVTKIGGAQMVVDPEDRIRGPFDIVSDLGFDPHTAPRETLVSPYHESSALCGTCHEVLNPAYRRNMLGQYEPSADETPIDDPARAFPEQQTYSEWSASAYASGGVVAPQFAGNGNGVDGDYTVGSCQSCHMPKTTGKAAVTGVTRSDMPVHELVGANTVVPRMIALHPTFGAEVNASVLDEGIERARRNLRRAATVSASLASGTLTVHVVNETGHKLPTGYPDGRRMWLEVVAYDAEGTVVFESGTYDDATAELEGYEAAPMDPDYDPYLMVWETKQGISPDVAMLTGKPAGPSFHLSLNNVRELDNRIPPRGFTNAAFEALDAAPVDASFADGEYWDDVTYPVGAAAARVEVRLRYQTTSKEYVEFLRDENVTTTDGDLLHSLWTQVDFGPPEDMAKVVVDTDAKRVAKCRKSVDKLQSKYLKTWLSAWNECDGAVALGGSCNAAQVTLDMNDEKSALRARLGGEDDRKCAGMSPATLGLGSWCPVPCASVVLFDMGDVADCAICVAESVGNAALEAAYGVTPPTLPAAVAGAGAQACQETIASATARLTTSWVKSLQGCEAANASGKNDPALVCTDDPSGKIGKAQESLESKIGACTSFAGIGGCAASSVDAATTSQCIEDALGAIVPVFPQVAYP